MQLGNEANCVHQIVNQTTTLSNSVSFSSNRATSYSARFDSEEYIANGILEQEKLDPSIIIRDVTLHPSEHAITGEYGTTLCDIFWDYPDLSLGDRRI
ncbi:uncharacterized protein BYT42DRAFT_580281 [Radiomyces spectabilis]|uniref:uncharacterized protein n=1 Tax=Radiomyces spectabilis TaxID=64574 RepID=UPI00221F92A0|nr:uncharacterized protein BYT42DRAFT_580281 [Radiomyces spectabilis]KAI8371448.1 hypothetical protein BYT42DRAFT_580281 [Radiomyces spectabilis]